LFRSLFSSCFLCCSLTNNSVRMWRLTFSLSQRLFLPIQARGRSSNVYTFFSFIIQI
jgi:hypothetical protein